uniref:PDZ domain-containing protein n=1 Tax=Amphiprion percula TaxID=161767 RepID=A0A3P8RJJ8_AMPPE
MSDEEYILEATVEATDLTLDLPSNIAPENTSEADSGSKKGPPVAPKPAWFRQSLRKIREEHDQKNQLKPSEKRPAAGFSGSFGARSASSAANLSIKQKIHSFETFSSPDSQEKGGNRRPVAPSTSLPQKETRSPCPSYHAVHGGYEKGKHELPKEVQSDQSASVREVDDVAVPNTFSAITPATYEVCSQTAKSSENEPPSMLSPTDILPSDNISTNLDSEIDDSPAASVNDDSKVLPSKLESEQEKVDLNRFTESSVLPTATSMRFDETEENASDGTDVDRRQSDGDLLRTAQSAAPPTENNLLRSPEEESLGKLIAFSNQVSQVLMHTLPMSCRGNPHSPNLQDGSALDFPNTQDSESGLDSTDRGFSVSLATLRECTIERGEGEAAFPSSYAHSVISAIPSQEIQRMIQEVKDLDQDALKQLVDIHVVILHKEEGAGLGFSIAGGCDLESKAPTVHRVFPSGLAAQEGTIQKGDEVLSINGQTLRGLTHIDATAALRQTRSLKLAVVVICKRAEEEGREGGGCWSEEPNPAVLEQGDPVSAELLKGPGGVGFTLEGGKGSIHGDRPLVLNRIFKGGAAEQSGLQGGDELLQVQGVSLTDMTRFEAWNMIKALPEGSVTVVIRRRQGRTE